jgi:hypothetical protein
VLPAGGGRKQVEQRLASDHRRDDQQRHGGVRADRPRREDEHADDDGGREGKTGGGHQKGSVEYDVERGTLAQLGISIQHLEEDLAHADAAGRDAELHDGYRDRERAEEAGAIELAGHEQEKEAGAEPGEEAYSRRQAASQDEALCTPTRLHRGHYLFDLPATGTPDPQHFRRL